VKVIDSDNYAASGIETLFFPGGEPHARIPENFGDALLFLKPRTWNDVGTAACVLDALYQQGWKKHRKVWLFCPYFPAARQDRTDYCTPITRSIMARILGQSVNRLYTFDLHSSPHGMGACVHKNFMPSDMVKERSPEGFYVICPDHGAMRRAQDFADANGSRHPIIVCDKQRDFATGKFTGFKLPALPEKGAVYVIIDDICDGGGTFNLLAEAFSKDPASEGAALALFVSHGIFSNGLNAIDSRIALIVTTNSWARLGDTGTQQDPGRLTVLSLQPVIDKILEDASV